MKNLKSVLLLICVLIPLPASADWKASFTAALKNGGALVVDQKGEVIFQHRAGEHFIPASTIKVATAAAAVHILGRDFRFNTDFFYEEGRLIVKGYGDPFLVSEEFPRIVSGLKAKGLKTVSEIIVDGGYFDSAIDIDGSSRSTNPYDAVNGALIANFNTINTRRSGGKILSAESQTPMTPIAESAARKFGGARVNLGKDQAIGARYFGELLAVFLENDGVAVSGGVRAGRSSSGEPFYRHVSSKTLEDNLKGLLEFSTNFISNQLFLYLGAHEQGAPATVVKGLSTIKSFLAKEVGWKNFELAEGAGLSRQNSVTPLQMMQLLNYFEKNADLLPLKEGVLRAKTGTLTGVNTLVGYFDDKNGGNVKFVILVNSAVPFDYKFRLGKMVYNGVNGE